MAVQYLQLGDNRPTFELCHYIGEVVLQFEVCSELETHVILGDSAEGFCRIDASLV